MSWPIIAEMDEIQLFMLCFPMDYLKNTVLPETNKYVSQEITLQEFFVFLGCLFFMACHPFDGKRDVWWSKDPISPKHGAPFRLNDYISRNRFKEIMQSIRYTNKPQPAYPDKFHDVREMQDAWNNHMETNYSPGWWNCLDESMNIYLNKYCPGFMIVPRKPHEEGNEYHTICDGDVGKGNPIMWHVELMEGKDTPDGAPPKKYSELGKTPGLMCRMMEPIKRTGKACTMDSGFCVSKGIVELEAKLGVYGQALIKKRGRYWPKGVPGDAIDEYFADAPIGASNTLEVEFEGKTLFIHCMKEEKYVTKFMSTFGTLDEVESHATMRRTAAGDVHFKYPEPMSWHNKSKHWVDDHNQRRHSPIDVAEVWKTQWWPHRQFCFFLTISEVNAANSRGRARGEQAEPVLTFRKKLAIAMLDNTFDDHGRIRDASYRLLRTRESIVEEHSLETRPNFSGKWEGRRWATTKQKHQKTQCYTCNKRIRTYCSCNRGLPMCQACHLIHVTNL